ncbi:MAG: hypothetical protein V4638_06325 [Bacteroidota bacterium]
MKIVLKFCLFFATILAISSCGDNEGVKAKDKEVTSKASDITPIETLFSDEAFENPKMKDLLKELNLCSEKTSDTTDYDHPSCSPKFFKFFAMNKQIPLENSFLLQIKSKVSGFPLRRLLVFVRERGQLVKANGFVANLIGTRKSSTGYDDLLLRFNGREEDEPIFYNCYFSWNGAKYEFASVEVIQGDNWGGPVKEAFKDSMKVEIKKVLSQQNMFF